MPDELMCDARRIRVEVQLYEVHLVFICATEEEAQLTFSAIERKMQDGEASVFTIKLGSGDDQHRRGLPAANTASADRPDRPTTVKLACGHIADGLTSL